MNLSHFQAMLWLRWRLSRNQWRRGGAINAALMLIVVFAVLWLAAVGIVGGVAGGLLGLSQAPAETSRLVFDGLVAAFLLMWTMGLVMELQQSQFLDLGRFLHLPVALRDVFVLNYLASLFSFSMAAVLPLMLGLSLGLLLGRGPAMLLMFPLVLGFFFMITAWTYWLRAWLAALMINKRRRQAIVMLLTLGLILLSQVPNLVMNVWGGPARNRPAQTAEEAALETGRLAKEREQMAAVYDAVHRAVPLLWLPHGVKGLAEGRTWPALWGAAGMIAIGAWGFRRAYRSTVRFYQGIETGKPLPAAGAGAGTAETRAEKKRILVERNLPFLPPQASALGLATLRSMSRAPEVKMALTVNLVFVAIMAVGAFMRGAGPVPAEMRPLVACTSVAITFMGLVQLMFNHFGFDRNGFRAIALLPTPRRDILLGKNLALFVVASGVFGVFLVLVAAMARLGVVEIATAILQFAAIFLIMSVLGNLASILVPYRIAAGSMKVAKTSTLMAFMIFVSHLVSMLAILPVLIPPLVGVLIAQFYHLPVALAALMCAVLLAALAALLYWRTLAPLGRLLKRRETRILEAVTHEAE